MRFPNARMANVVNWWTWATAMRSSVTSISEISALTISIQNISRIMITHSAGKHVAKRHVSGPTCACVCWSSCVRPGSGRDSLVAIKKLPGRQRKNLSLLCSKPVLWIQVRSEGEKENSSSLSQTMLTVARDLDTSQSAVHCLYKKTTFNAVPPRLRLPRYLLFDRR